MAVNYTFGRAVEIIARGEDIEAIQDIGKRFPVLMCYASKIVAKAGDDFVAFASKMPEYLTALKVNSALKADAVDAVDSDEEAEGNDDAKAVDKPVEAPKPTKGRRGRPKKVVTEEAVEDVEDAVEDGYNSMSAVELFKECKKRGIKTEPKQKASVYIKLLETDDAKNKKVDDDDDDWGDDEEDEKSASKPAKSTKPAKAAKKETKSEDTDDDDWDI